MLLTYVIWVQFIIVRVSLPSSRFSSHSNIEFTLKRYYISIYISILGCACCCTWVADTLEWKAWPGDTEKQHVYINQQGKELFLHSFLHKRKKIRNSQYSVVYFQWRMNLLPAACEPMWCTSHFLMIQDAWYFAGFCCEKYITYVMLLQTSTSILTVRI